MKAVGSPTDLVVNGGHVHGSSRLGTVGGLQSSKRVLGHNRAMRGLISLAREL